ncbi:MAG: thymidine kinase [Verrucomicrobiales bacterium]|nr:thymidine kinase [Verrucomicrobiales bacterium]|tara:strand:+ start:325 stop:909 length:585 start_codon:yes stop_codon:yes gene_type:complete
MAQFYFYYSAMNAGKSTVLLQSSYNYKERGMNTLVLKPALDDRDHITKVSSRIGLDAEAVKFEREDNLLEITQSIRTKYEIACVLVDEAQFLSEDQVRQLTDVCDDLNIPVLAYGLRTDFQGKLFPGSEALFAFADNFVEIKTICHCGRKATMVLRVGADGTPVREGEQIEIGGNERYMSVCRQHFKEGKAYAD